MRAVAVLLCVVVVSASASCVRDLPLGSVVQGNTSADCRYRVDLSGADDRLWSLELLSESVAIQVVVMDEQLVALQTLYSGKLGDGGALQETICRRTLPVTHRLESVFYLAPLGQDAVGFSLQVFSLPKAQLYLDKPVLDVISQRSHFFYFLLPEGGLPAPLSVAIESGELPDAPYQLQVSWKGCPDMTLRDSSHQVLSFVSKARMLVLPSQLESIGSPPPDVVYVGVRPRPHVAGSLVPTYNETDAVKNLTITLSYGPSFSTSGVAVAQWATMLAVLSVFVCAACCASYLVLRPGVKRLHSASSIPRSIEFAHEDKSRRLGDRRTRGRAKAYLWMIVLAGLFYLLPSLQTAGAEASGMLTSGNHDVCFFNEFCMFPLQTFGPYGIMWFAANNVLSNTGYIMMAIVIFSWTMWCKWMWGDKEVVLRVLSLPHDYTLFYCLAVALFFEGLMSATYHICPTRLLFTIDTTYMFVGSILISLEVYRKWFRMLPHPMFPFCLLTALMVFNYFGTFLDIYGAEDLAPIVQGQSDTAARVLWVVVFVLMWGAVIIVVSIRHRTRMPLKVLVFMTSANCLFGLLPIVSFLDGVAFADRSTLLLGVALCSAVFNLFAYVIGTLHRVDMATRLFRLVLGMVVFGFGGPAVYFFGISPSNKAVSPWASRGMNEPCVSGGFYDAHDIWHFLSAVALAATIFLLMHSGEQSGEDGYEAAAKADSVQEPTMSDQPPNESTPLINSGVL